MVYWGRVNDDVFETCVNTFRKYSNALLQVHTDNKPKLTKNYNIDWQIVSSKKVKKRRALCKIELLKKVVDNLKDGDRILVADVDLYFMADPFDVFENPFDLAVTTRSHEYRYPINGGVFFLRINKYTREFVDFYLEQCLKPNWRPLKEFRFNVGHYVYNPDWEIGQDFLCAYWMYWMARHSIDVFDAGFKWNFCPNTDHYGLKKAKEILRKAYEEKFVKILHLKSELKYCIYDGWLEDVIIHKGGLKEWNWYEKYKDKPFV